MNYSTKERETITFSLQLGRVLKILGRQLADAISVTEISLTVEQFILLFTINKEKEVTQHQLTEILKKDKSGIMRLTDELESKKLIFRAQDSNDRRKKFLIMTKVGIDRLEQVIQIESQIIQNLLADVDDDELVVFASVLKKILLKDI